MLTDRPNPRQQSLDAIAAKIFTEPALARKQCIELLEQARLGADGKTFIAAAVQYSLIEDQLGDAHAALKLLSEAMAYAQEFHLIHEIPVILEQMGCCYYSLARYPQALQCWRQCAMLCGNQASMSKTRGLALIGLGRICDAAGNNELAVKMHQSGHQLLQITDDAYLITMAKINWAVNLQKLQQYDAACILLSDALVLSQQNHLPHHIAEILFRLSQIAIVQQQDGLAESYIEDGMLTLSETPYHWVEVNLLAEWARLQARQGKLIEALATVKRGLELAQTDDFKNLEMVLLQQAQGYANDMGLSLIADEYQRKASFLLLHLQDEIPASEQLDLDGLNALALPGL
ncbi:hypothetical protein [Chitinibacter sp. S2-10]|uniref:hypothetical protein n=1 Tax=Chitinibacter sp. S2-10 TaxID=3373597 RepID=UPI0039779641